MKIFVLVKESSYERLVLQDKDEKTIRLLRESSIVTDKLKISHDEHTKTTEHVRDFLQSHEVEYKTLTEHTSVEIPEDTDLVITVGGDGTFLAASHAVSSKIPIFGINSAPSTSVGFFCRAKMNTAKKIFEDIQAGVCKEIQVSRMQIALNDVVITKRVLNEALFCHASPAATTRYFIEICYFDSHTVSEEQKSSGFWIGPPAGSTAAIRSAGGIFLPLAARELQLVVRELYLPIFQNPEESKITNRFLKEKDVVSVLSKTRRGKLFLDGNMCEHNVEIGDRIEFSLSDENLRMFF